MNAMRALALAQATGGGPSIEVEALSVTENNTYTAPSGKAYSPVTVAVPALAPAPENDVEFIDYDGTIVASYSADDFAGLTAMPGNPSHDGLTAQGWNWSLSDAKDYVAAYGKLVIGQVYITDDGKTRIYVAINGLRPKIYVTIGVNGTATVDWGDGGTASTVTGSDDSTSQDIQHTYAAAGDYVIAIAVTGTMALRGDSSVGSRLVWSGSSSKSNNVYRNRVRKVEIGANCKIMAYAFSSCASLESITFPNGVAFTGDYWCEGCYSLKSATIPYGVTSIQQYAFSECSGLKRLSLAIGLTQIYQRTLYNCRTIGKITPPTGVTQIGTEAFNKCDALKDVVFPNTVTTIGDKVCYFDKTLTKITIPENVTSIGMSSIYQCAGLKELHFKPTTPPALGSSVFNGLPTDVVIYVPTGYRSAYTGTSGYPNSGTYIYMEE